MKIISDFKDYYDYGIAYGIDENIVYERFQKTIQVPKHINHRQGGVLGLCDEFWQVDEIPVEEKLPFWQRNFRHGQTYEERIAGYIENGWIEGSPIYDKYDKEKVVAYYWIKLIPNINNFEWYQNYSRVNYTKWNNWLKSIFVEHGVPSFYIDDKTEEALLNPKVADYGLQKLRDSVEVFQTLSTFIPSLRVVDPFNMTDEQKGKSKGFDNFSFRHKNTKNKPKKF